MPRDLGFVDRAWVAPEVCSLGGGGPHQARDLQGTIERAQDALNSRSIGRVIHALVALRSVLRSRLGDEDVLGAVGDHERLSIGRWRRRLRRRYSASLYALEHLIEKAWSSFSLDEIGTALDSELAKLRRIETLENQARLDLSWTDIGVGD